VGDWGGIRLTTNTAAHLFMRSTRVEPVKTLTPKEKRGAVWYYDNKMCFVAWQEQEQEEPGDTLVHTFPAPLFPTCVNVWYYFLGTIGGVASLSNTAIFSSHMTWPAPPVCNMPAPSNTLKAGPGVAKGPAINTPTFTLSAA